MIAEVEHWSLARRRLRWRARRGLLENDLILSRFFETHGDDLTASQMVAVETLLDLPEDELLDVLLARADVRGALDVPDVRALVQLLRAG
ncbi:MAG: succinate dehydrogenase assembly factor 2 [Burkholderiaceae bacterium]|nr:succinate dehydrogenase assembly factor 2 [Burkholderiaceae bacterium]